LTQFDNQPGSVRDYSFSEIFGIASFSSC